MMQEGLDHLWHNAWANGRQDVGPLTAVPSLVAEPFDQGWSRFRPHRAEDFVDVLAVPAVAFALVLLDPLPAVLALVTRRAREKVAQPAHGISFCRVSSLQQTRA